MKDYREIHFGSEAIAYVRNRLEQSKALGHYLLGNLDLDKGHVITCLPQTVGEDVAKKFQHGVFPLVPGSERHVTAPDGTTWRMTPKPNMNFWLTSVMKTFLKAGDNRACIFEDAVARPTDPYLERVVTRRFSVSDTVYHYLLSDDAEQDEKIDQTIKQASSWLFIGVLAALPSDFWEAPDLLTIVSGAQKIVIGAYDGESYLIWEKELQHHA